MRRIPSGAMQKFYKRLYDLWQRYPDRWVHEKQYADADYFNHKMVKLLKDVSAALKGQPIPGTIAQDTPHRGFSDRMSRPDLGYGVQQVRDREGFAHLEDPYEQMRDDSLPRFTRMSTGRTRLVPKTTAPPRSRSVRPVFLRRGKAFKRKSR